MKILFLTLEYPPFHGGVANYYGQLVKSWPKADQLTVIDNRRGELVNPAWPFFKWLPGIFKIKKIIKENNIQQLIIGHILPLGITGLYYFIFSGLKYTVVLHGLDFTSALKVRRKKMVAKLVLNKAGKIICANRYTAGLVKNFLGERAGDRVEVVNPGAEISGPSDRALLDSLRAKHSLNNKIILLSVGRLIPRKGFSRVINALPEALKTVPNLIYVLIGSGEEKDELTAQIKRLNLIDRVFIVDQATDQERNCWYELCDIFIMLPYRIGADFEGFGMVYLEANLAGKPVIASTSGGVGDAVINGKNGLTVSGDNSDEISRAIVSLAQDGALRQKLGEQGKQRARDEFNWLKQAAKFQKLLP